MGKAKGTGNGRGGFFGMYDALGQMASCLFCLMCLGPILLIAGVYVMSLAAQDNRGVIIKEYGSAVEKWNSGAGASGEFKGYDISAKFSTAGQPPTTVLLGSVAPEPLGDQSLRSSEAFVDVVDPWYYSTLSDDKTINTAYPGYDGCASFASCPPPGYTKGTSVSLTFEGTNVESSTTDFFPVVAYDTPYSWYCSSSSSSSRRRSSGGSSSSSCSNTCNDPDSYNRNTAVSDCDDWCRDIGGTWYDNGKCYQSQSSSATATGCCHVYYGARDACFTSKVSNTDLPREAHKVIVSQEACETSNTQVKSEDGTILYGAMTSKTQWGAGMKISIRHELDPYIQASRITGGCTSGTSGSMNYMTGYSAPSGTSSQCFGLTPEQLLNYAYILLFFGFVFSSVPCGVMYCLLKRKNNTGNNYNNNNNNNNAGVIVAGGQQHQGVMLAVPQNGNNYGQQQIKQQQIPQAIYAPQVQPVQPVYQPQYQPQPMVVQPQPVQQVYQPQPVQQVYQPQPVQPLAVNQPGSQWSEK